MTFQSLSLTFGFQTFHHNWGDTVSVWVQSILISTYSTFVIRYDYDLMGDFELMAI